MIPRIRRRIPIPKTAVIRPINTKIMPITVGVSQLCLTVGEVIDASLQKK